MEICRGKQSESIHTKQVLEDISELHEISNKLNFDNNVPEKKILQILLYITFLKQNKATLLILVRNFFIVPKTFPLVSASVSVSLSNGISTFLGYFMLIQSL